MFGVADTFSVTPLIVGFTRPVVGSSRTPLHDQDVLGVGDTQQKCYSFVRLLIYPAPGNPTKTPFKGFHLFQVFVIFPIHVNPWPSLCK